MISVNTNNLRRNDRMKDELALLWGIVLLAAFLAAGTTWLPVMWTIVALGVLRSAQIVGLHQALAMIRS